VIATEVPETLAPSRAAAGLSIDARELLNPDDEAAGSASGAHYLRGFKTGSGE
jgi:hypothetical protein